jgi:hypothetical protein
MRPADPQQLNLYTYVRNNPLRHIDPTGLDLYATGSEAERYRKDLEKATGLKLQLDAKTGQITIVKEPNKLGADAQKIKGIITDSKNMVRIDAIRDPAGSKQVLVLAEVVNVKLAPGFWSGHISAIQRVEFKAVEVLKGRRSSPELEVEYYVVKNSPLADTEQPRLSPKLF